MHSSSQVAGKKADPGTAQRVALIAWSICISLIFAATVLRFLEEETCCSMPITFLLVLLLAFMAPLAL